LENFIDICGVSQLKSDKMKKLLLTFLAVLFSFAVLKAQDNLIINLVDNSSVTVAFSHIKKIAFNNDNLLLKTIITTNSYPLNTIASITFLNEVGIKEFSKTINIHVFVNGIGEIVVETPHQVNKLTVFDLTGRQVAIGTQNKLNVNFLTTGIYILQVATDKGLVSKKFIKNR